MHLAYIFKKFLPPQQTNSKDLELARDQKKLSWSSKETKIEKVGKFKNYKFWPNHGWFASTKYLLKLIFLLLFQREPYEGKKLALWSIGLVRWILIKMSPFQSSLINLKLIWSLSAAWWEFLWNSLGVPWKYGSCIFY